MGHETAWNPVGSSDEFLARSRLSDPDTLRTQKGESKRPRLAGPFIIGGGCSLLLTGLWNFP